VKFRDNFERETILLLAAARRKNKENRLIMKRKPFKLAILAAILVLVLTGTALAVSMLLSPKGVAEQGGDILLAEAFQSADALIINKTEQTGPYDITLLGIVSGKGLSTYCEETEEDKSYIVAALSNTDGTPVIDCTKIEVTFTPLVSSYKPWQINAWTLGGARQSFVYEGVYYAIFECSNLEIFADHTVYLAAYKGNAPGADTFVMQENGEIAFNGSYTGIKAMFTIPLDPLKADPAAAQELLQSLGFTQ
jgi:hypothetical protein